MPDQRPKPLTDTQYAALAKLAATGQMTHDGRVANALQRRGLVTRDGATWAVTDAGQSALGAGHKPGKFSARKPTTCCVEGCGATVYGEYDMCGKHFDKWVNGLLKPKSQGGAA